MSAKNAKSAVIKKHLGLYIHIPFCVHKCDYCNFVSFDNKTDEDMNTYLNALLKEIGLRAPRFKNYKVEAIYIGGGTPSVLPDGAASIIMDAVKKHFNMNHDAEITIEVNPKSATEQKLAEYKNAGINRLSIGGQSCSDKLLRVLGRSHNAEDFKTALLTAQKYFKNINADMMIGVPQQTLKDVKAMLKMLIKNEIKHISVYSLMLEEGTPMQAKVQSGALKEPDEDETVKMYNLAIKMLKKAGIMRYEVSNFALPGYECRHNINYWILEDYLGLGLAAHSLINNVRFCNTENFALYIKDISHKKFPIENEETLSLKERKEEYIMLGLRTKNGLKLDRFNKEFNCNLLLDKAKEVEMLIKNKLIVADDGFLQLCDSAFYVLNSIVQKLID